MLRFKKIQVAKKFMNNREGYQDSPTKTFRLTVPESSVKEAFIVFLILGAEKFRA